jgi:heme A synthase
VAFGVGAGCLFLAAVVCIAGLAVAGLATTRQLPYMPDPGRGWIYLGMGLNALPILLTGVVVVLSALMADKVPPPNR